MHKIESMEQPNLDLNNRIATFKGRHWRQCLLFSLFSSSTHIHHMYYMIGLGPNYLSANQKYSCLASSIFPFSSSNEKAGREKLGDDCEFWG